MLRLYARAAAANLERGRLPLLVERGYAGLEMAWSDFGSQRGQMPASAVRSLLEEHQLRLCVRVVTARLAEGSAAPEAHAGRLDEALADFDDQFGGLVDLVIAEVTCKNWKLPECVAFARGLAGVRAKPPVALATDRTHWGTTEPIDKVLARLSVETPALDMSRVSLSLNPAPWIGGATEQTQDTEHDYARHVSHLNLTPGWSAWPPNYWTTVGQILSPEHTAVRKGHRPSVSLPAEVAFSSEVHPFEESVRAAAQGKVQAAAATPPAAPSPTASAAMSSELPRASNEGASGGAGGLRGDAGGAGGALPLASRVDAVIAARSKELESLVEMREENARLFAEVDRLTARVAALEALADTRRMDSSSADASSGGSESVREQRPAAAPKLFKGRRQRAWLLDPKRTPPSFSVPLSTPPPAAEESTADAAERAAPEEPQTRPHHDGGLGHLQNMIKLPFAR